MLSSGQDAAQIELGDAFTRIELRRVESEYAQLAKGGTKSDAERQRFQEVSRRLAELKGASGVTAPGAA